MTDPQPEPILLPEPLTNYLVLADGSLARLDGAHHVGIEGMPLPKALSKWNVGKAALDCRCVYPGLWELLPVGDRPPQGEALLRSHTILSLAHRGRVFIHQRVQQRVTTLAPIPPGRWWHDAAGLREVVLDSFTEWPGVIWPLSDRAVRPAELDLPEWLSSESRRLLRGADVDRLHRWNVLRIGIHQSHLVAAPIVRDWVRNQRTH